MKTQGIIERRWDFGRVFYVYEHVDLAGRVFYVGKGRDGRAWDHTFPKRSYAHVSRLAELLGQGVPLGGWVRIVESGLLHWQAADLENRLIRQHTAAGAPLVNVAGVGREVG